MTGNYLAGNCPENKRNKGDFYQTPYHCTRMLCDVEKFQGSILEPAAGSGAIIKVLNEKGYNNIISYDIETNFLLETKQYNNIITNPPYRLANDFIKVAKKVATQKVAMILPLNYLQGKKRYKEVFQDTIFPLQYVYVFSRYLFMKDTIREDGTCGCGMVVFAWFVWNKSYVGEPILKWLDNDKYIKGDKK